MNTTTDKIRYDEYMQLHSRMSADDLAYAAICLRIDLTPEDTRVTIVEKLSAKSVETAKWMQSPDVEKRQRLEHDRIAKQISATA